MQETSSNFETSFTRIIERAAVASHMALGQSRVSHIWLWTRAGSRTSGSERGQQVRNKKDPGQSCEMQRWLLEPAQPLERSGPLPTAEKD